jgi:hypothetical protein
MFTTLYNLAVTTIWKMPSLPSTTTEESSLSSSFNLSIQVDNYNDHTIITNETRRKLDLLQEDATTKNDNSTEMWENDHNFVHVILTRFMQHQPDLLHLGRARLELFKSFCLPTMQKQTSKQFLWIIRADPNLHPDLKAEFLDTIRQSISSMAVNVVVVGSNARIDDGHFRHENSIADINESSLWLGSMDVVKRYHEAAQTRIVLETGLDADDGLALDFVADIQQQTSLLAKAQQGKEANQQTTPSWWKIWCVNHSTEWQYYGTYLNSMYGYLGEATADPNVCITPGLTRVSTPDYRTWKESKGKANRKDDFQDLASEGYRFFVDHYFIQLRSHKRHVHKVGGWSYLPGTESRAMRARSPTSAGMKNVVDNVHDIRREMTESEQEAWNSALLTFGLSKNAIRKSRKAIKDDLLLVLNDAIAGQCSEGHSCKKGSAEVLSRLRRQAKRSV